MIPGITDDHDESDFLAPLQEWGNSSRPYPGKNVSSSIIH